MFMTNYELIYGECKGTSSNSSPTVHREQPAPTKEKGKGTETAVKAAKAVVGAHVAAAKFAGGAVSKLSKKAVDYAKSDDAAEKAAFAKEKAGAAFAGLKGKASAFAERKKADNSDTPVDDVIEDVNDITEETYTETETADNAEEIAESANFDELYEKAMNTANDEESYDEAVAIEDDTMDGCSEDTVDEGELPVVSPSISQASAPAVMPQSTPRQFSYEEEKKSPVVFVLVGVIAVLLVEIGILGGILLMKNKDDKGSDNSSNNEVIATTEDITTGETTASVQKTTSEIVSTTQETTTEVATNISVISEEEIENAKNNAIADLRNNLTTVFSNNGANLPALNATTDYDINGDDIPELIISYMGIADSKYHIYYYDGSKFIELKECWGGLDISVDNHLICERHYGGGEVSCYYEISNNYKLNQIDEISSFPVQNGTSYYRNGQPIDTSEYYAAINYYNDMNWINISSDSTAPENNNNSNGNDRYTTYDTSAAGSDFSFNNEPYSRMVTTESSGLNLRAAPSTSAEIIVEMPKNSNVSLWGVNSEWAYVSYVENGKTYYGYAARQYIGLPDNNATLRSDGNNIALSDQIVGRWRSYKYTDSDSSSSYDNGFVYDFKIGGKVDIDTNDGRVFTDSSWYVSGTDVIIKNTVAYGLEYKISMVNGELRLYNSDYELTFYLRKEN